jgi:hypothetical protein
MKWNGSFQTFPDSSNAPEAGSLKDGVTYRPIYTKQDFFSCPTRLDMTRHCELPSNSKESLTHKAAHCRTTKLGLFLILPMTQLIK